MVAPGTQRGEVSKGVFLTQGFQKLFQGSYLRADERHNGFQSSGDEREELRGVLPMNFAVELGKPVAVRLEGCQRLRMPGRQKES